MIIDEQGNPRETQKDFYGNPVAELIDKTYYPITASRARQRRQSAAADNQQPIAIDMIDPQTGDARAGEGIHLCPTKRRRKDTGHALQGRCILCKQHKTTMECSGCVDDPEAPASWICNITQSNTCFPSCMMDKHR
jgi:hypothetical protein